MRAKSGLKFFYFKIPGAPSEFLQKNQPRKAELACPEGARSISKRKILGHFSPSFLSQKWSFQDLVNSLVHLKNEF